MIPHVIGPRPGIKPSGIEGKRPPAFPRGFYPPCMRFLAGSRAAAGRVEHRCIYNVTNHLRVINSVYLRACLYPSASFRRAVPAMKGAGTFVTQMIDGALREQLERELTLMERGENVAGNQHRRLVLRRALESRPAQVLKHFYAAQMRILASASQAAGEADGIQHDIIREQNVRNTETVYERHYEQVIQGDRQAAEVRAGDVQRIADQVMRQLDRRLKSRRDRNGIW